MDYARDLIDEVPFGADVETMEVRKMDDMDADACIEKISNWERYREFWLDYYQKKIDEVNQKCDRNIAYQRRNLRDYFATVPHRSTKTMEAYDLPHGKIQVTFSKPCLVPNKDAILADLDNLDYEDKHYQRRKTDLENRLSKTYDKIEETENALVEVKSKKRSILAEKICGDNIYKALIFFDKMYEPMNEAERREFLTQFIEKVEIYEEEQANGQWLKSIEFKLPIISKDMKISLDNGSQIETVCSLQRK